MILSEMILKNAPSCGGIFGFSGAFQGTQKKKK